MSVNARAFIALSRTSLIFLACYSNRNQNRQPMINRTRKKRRLNRVLLLETLLVTLLVVSGCGNNEPPKQARSTPAPAAPAPEQTTPSSELVTMDVAKAVMVTVELDFGPRVPSIAEAITQVERRYHPDDGQG